MLCLYRALHSTDNVSIYSFFHFPNSIKKPIVSTPFYRRRSLRLEDLPRYHRLVRGEPGTQTESKLTQAAVPVSIISKFTLVLWRRIGQNKIHKGSTILKDIKGNDGGILANYVYLPLLRYREILNQSLFFMIIYLARMDGSKHIDAIELTRERYRNIISK